MTEPTVSRWIDGPITLDGAPAFAPVSDTVWRADARLASFPVEVELVFWGAGSAELSVRPARRPLFTWGGRREERYFDQAHALADQLATELQPGPDAEVVRPAAWRRSDSYRRPPARKAGSAGQSATRWSA